VTAFAATTLAGGAVLASGLVDVEIAPDQGPSGTRIEVSARGFRDTGKRTFDTPTYWAEISIGSSKVATGVPVAADLTVKQGIVVNASPGEQNIVVTMYARDPQGTRYIDSGSKTFRVYDPGPAHPLSVSMHVTAPERTLSGNDVIVNVTLQSGAGDKTKVGLYAGLYDQSNKLVRSLAFTAAPPAQGLVSDRIEMMEPNRTEQFASGPFSLTAGTWRIHFTLLVNNVAHDMDRTIVVTAAPRDPTPKKPPPHLVPDTPSR
jgi:hypothetical protein